MNCNSNNILHILALETVFDVNVCKYFSCYETQKAQISQEDLLQFDILKRIDNDLQSTHRTPAEYFVAQCISNELCNNQNVQFFKFLCEDILASDRYKVVRAYVDTFLQTDSNSPPNQTLILIANTVMHTDYNFLLCTLAGEGLLELLKLLFKCCHAANITIDMKSIRVRLNHAIHQAASNSHFEIVKFLIENGTPIDVRNQKDLTVLHLVAKTGNLAMVKFLVETGAEVNSKDSEGRTALHEASTSGSFDMVRYLLENGAYINSRDRDGYTALHIAASMGDIDRVKYLVENGADIHSKGCVSGTVISNAALSVNIDVIKYLVETGADVTVKTKSGGSILQLRPDRNKNICFEKVIEVWKFLLGEGVDINAVLHEAIESGYGIDYIRFLVEQGAEVNKDYLLNAAISRNDVEILKYLLDNGAIFNLNHNQDEKIYEAVAFHRIDVVRHLGERGISLDVTSETGEPALNAAIKNNDFDMIKLLVQNNVKIDRLEVLKLALERCNFETVKLLVDHGANAKINFGEVKSSDLEAVKFLLEKGAKFGKFLDVGNNLELLKYLFNHSIEIDKTFIFSEAIKKDNLGIIEFLLANGVDVNMKIEQLQSPLHLATACNRISVIEYLLDNGADIEITNGSRTPLYVATSEGCLEAAKVLLDRGANVQNVTSCGQNALTFAMKKRHVETVKYVVGHGAPLTVYPTAAEAPLVIALSNGLLEAAECVAENDPRYRCKLEEVIQRLINKDNIESTEDQRILLYTILRVELVKHLIAKGVDFTPRVIDRYRSLFSAVTKGDLKLVKNLIEKGCDVNIRDYSYGYNALHRAIDFNMAKLLIENGVNVNVKDRMGRSPLNQAIEKSNLDMCKLLIENGADVNETNREKRSNNAGCTLLHMTSDIDKIKYLIEKGTKLTLSNDGRNILLHAVADSHIDLDLVKYLLTLGQDVNCRDRMDRTPLNAAIARGDLDVVRLLVENGAEMDKDITNKPEVLFDAIRHRCYGSWNCSLDMVKYLVSKGANVNAKDRSGNNMLHHAISEKDLEMVKFLLNSGADVNAIDNYSGYSPLYKACSSNNFPLIKCLIDNGALLDAKTTRRRSVLHEAASTSSYSAVKHFLDNGVDVNVRDDQGRTPLHDVSSPHAYSHTTESFHVLKLLIERGADVNVKTKKGVSPLHECVSDYRHDKVELLIENGADVNAKGEFGRTPMFALVMANKGGRSATNCDAKRVAELLIKSGANINEKSGNGRTALHEAIITRRLDTVRFLLELGADVNNVALSGGTPLHDAAKRGMLNAVEFFVRNGAKLHLKNKKGDTALDEARKGEHDNIVEFLAKSMANVKVQSGN